MEYILRFTGEQHKLLQQHLFPGDGNEAAALVLCGRRNGHDRHVLIARQIVPIPYEAYEERTPQRVVWPTRFVDPLLPNAAKRSWGILKIHSHPTGYLAFSTFDNKSDLSFLGSMHQILEDGFPHGSAAMLPDGRIFGRILDANREFHSVELVAVAGDDVFFWHIERDYTLPEFVISHAQIFGKGTTQLLHRLHIAVIGCSGTGGPLIEQLVRLGVGRLVLVEPDKVEERNLNRVPFTTLADAQSGRLKIDVIAEAVDRIGLGTQIVRFPQYLDSPDTVRAVAECDFIFGCMDNMSGRDLLNRLATFYSIPYIDLATKLFAKQNGGIDQIFGAVHYLQPGQSSLRSRGVYNSEDIRAEMMKRDAPEEYQKLLKEKYIKGVEEDRPAVISINTQVASMGVNEMLARVHHFRYEPNSEFAAQCLVLHEGFIDRSREADLPSCEILKKEVGKGDVIPLLNRPELSD
jgi:hypothetical protein